MASRSKQQNSWKILEKFLSDSKQMRKEMATGSYTVYEIHE